MKTLILIILICFVAGCHTPPPRYSGSGVAYLLKTQHITVPKEEAEYTKGWNAALDNIQHHLNPKKK